MSCCWISSTRSPVSEKISHCTHSLIFLLFFFFTVWCKLFKNPPTPTLFLTLHTYLCLDLINNYKRKTQIFRTDEFSLSVVMVLQLSLWQSYLSSFCVTVRSRCVKMWWKPLFPDRRNYKLLCVTWSAPDIILQKQKKMVLYSCLLWAGLLCCQFSFWSTPCLHGFIVLFP